MPTENLDRSDHTLGWVPSADLVNGPANGLLRMDNCVLDEQGAVALRKGTIAVYDTPFPHGDTAVNAIFSCLIDGAKHRYYGVDDGLYHEQGRVATASGSHDAAFAAHLGMVMMARGNLRKKHDGSQLYDWGLDPPPQPTITAVPGPITVLAHGSEDLYDFSINPIPPFVKGKWFVTPGSTHADNHANAANQAVLLGVPGTALAFAQAVFAFNNTTDLDGNQEDHFSFYLNLPGGIAGVSRIALMFDCGDGTFQQDYYYFDMMNVLKPDTDNAQKDQSLVQAPSDQFLDGDHSIPGTTRPIRLSLIRNLQDKVRKQMGLAVASGTFVKLSAARAQFGRVGNTAGKDWKTINAVQIYIDTPNDAPTIDTVAMQKGKLTGKYAVRAAYTRVFPHYQAFSGPSEASDEANVECGTFNVTVPASGQGQVNDIWIYIQGGALDVYYLAKKAGSNAGGTFTLDVSERDMLLDDEEMQLTIGKPPTGEIVGISDPWYDRVFVLTETLLWPSKQIDLDAFDPGQALQVGDGTQVNYWVVKTLGGLYVGTNRDIVRVDGNGVELPDGEINFRITSMNIGHPPINQCFARSGNTIVYVASDGPRVFDGATSTPITNAVDLLWKGYTRYGVGPVDTSSRMRAAFAQGNTLKIILQEVDIEGGMRIDEFKKTPSGGLTDADRFRYATFGFNLASTSVRGRTIHCYDFIKQRWYRHIYTNKVLSIWRDPDDGTLLQGDDQGNVWQMDLGFVGADQVRAGQSGVPMEFTILTKLDDNGRGLNRKDPYDLQVHLDSDNASAVALLYSDEEDAPSKTIYAQGSLDTLFRFPIPDLTPFIRLGLGIIGTSSATLRFWGFNVAYRPRPQIAVYRDTGYVDTPEWTETSWWREAWLKIWTRATQVVVTPYFDGVVFPGFTVDVPVPGEVNRIRVPFPRNYKGKQPRAVVQTVNPTGTMRIDEFPAAPHGGGLDDDDRSRYANFGFDPGQRDWDSKAFELYWVKFRRSGSGSETEKQYLTVNLP